ncbi:GT4 family glycosyltransferase PelF [Hoeflea sp. G2-23]|uniref:GT4 family glycosyltransferase PelF n=1 Tax=Hoeflea algicola TaxID=2983763 RepID=A0ABT3ZC89_9HYPH|nr:GT4 family glycosyltransferase PelF [Hoeflea algicola]MCY0149395.1 GT4 family glycosyltransferase PelF [Hoeflea algicola]
MNAPGGKIGHGDTYGRQQSLIDGCDPSFSLADDVCLITEGSYPFVLGGVSAWTQSLMEMHPEKRFHLVSIQADERQLPTRYAPPVNLASQQILPLRRRPKQSFKRRSGTSNSDIAVLLTAISKHGDRAALEQLIRLMDAGGAYSPDSLLNSRLAFDTVRQMYSEACPEGSFLGYFWTWRALHEGLVGLIEAKLPDAAIYHATTTGYAGLLAAICKIRFDRKVVVTEHGLYARERWMELLTQPPVGTRIDTGYTLTETRPTISRVWGEAFDAFARLAYQSADCVTTLFETNRRHQIEAGASPEQTRIIPNGVRMERFDARRVPLEPAPPRIALIGRVVPIKDICSFIEAVALIIIEFPDLSATIAGPMNENPNYAKICQRLVEKKRLETIITFAGNVPVEPLLMETDVHVLTSISEGQPLALLEACAAGVPSVVTDVGACREILLTGPGGQCSDLPPGGIVVDPVSPAAIADAVAALLRSPELRQEMGTAARQRVSRNYREDVCLRAYGALYSELLDHEEDVKPWRE